MSTNVKVVQPGQPPVASDINQLIQALLGTIDVGELQLAKATNPPSAPVIATIAGSLTGTYKYQLVYITGWVDSYYNLYVNGFVASPETTQVLAAQNAVITIPAWPTSVIAVAIYRTVAGGATGTEKYAGIVFNPSITSYTDSLADGSLGTGMLNGSSSPMALNTEIPINVPTVNTTGTFLVLPNTTFYPPVGRAGTVTCVNSQMFVSNGTTWLPSGSSALTNPLTYAL